MNQLTLEHEESYTVKTTAWKLDRTNQEILGIKWNYEQGCLMFDLGPCNHTDSKEIYTNEEERT